MHVLNNRSTIKFYPYWVSWLGTFFLSLNLHLREQIQILLTNLNLLEKCELVNLTIIKVFAFNTNPQFC